jgi:replication initiation protein RepC
MQTHIATTPFGRRPLSLAMLAAQEAANDVRPNDRADKWKLFRDICEARPMLGATDRALAVLNALISFYPEGELSGEGNLVVFPSNQQLALRTHGMAPTTLRRHLSVLVECGLVIRRDSPNGKRYARKGQGDEIEQAYGFDLSPLLSRAAEFAQLANEVRAERRALQMTRERMTLYRRDIAKMISFGLEEGISANWEALHLEFRGIVCRIPRLATRDELAPLEADLRDLSIRIRKALENHVNAQKADGNESHNGVHIQNSNTDSHLNFEPRSRVDQGPNPEPKTQPQTQPQPTQDLNQPNQVEPSNPASPPSPPAGYPLGLVMRACPDIADYARNGISRWEDLISAANLVRSALGVSPDAWNQACEAMGQTDAAIVVAAILQRSDQISSAGGYLRALTDKARTGEFSIGPILMALLRAKGRTTEKRAG